MLFGQQGPAYRYNNMHDRPLLGLLVMLLIVAGVTVLVSWLVARAMSNRHHQHPHAPMVPAGAGVGMGPAGPPPSSGDNALATLRVRYARGEVSRTDYLQAVADLTGQPFDPGPPDPPKTNPI